MQGHLILDLFFVFFAALLGGIVSRIVKAPTLIGYILAGLAASLVLPLVGLMGPEEQFNIQSLAELGIILLLFSIGLEVSAQKLFKVGNIVLYGSIAQILLTIAFSWVGLQLLGLTSTTAIIFAIGISLSSTALVVKLLTDRNEKGTVYGEIMIGWLLMQDLAVIPIMALLPAFGGHGNFLSLATTSIISSAAALFAVFFLGRLVVPPIIHKVAALNSRELLSLTAFCIAIGTAFLVSAFGVSAALGAFLAGVVISESQENHAVFAEMRPLRDLFVVLFFVSLGFFVSPAAIVTNLPLIISIVVFVLIIKILVVLGIMIVTGHYGKNSIAVSLGLAQVGEFSFIIYLAAARLGILTPELTSVGIAVTLISLMLTPLMFKNIIPVWRKLKSFPAAGKYFLKGYNREIDDKEFKNHIVICGYGRVGKWVGKAMQEAGVEFVAIDYNQKIVAHARKMGIKAIYGDPSDPEILREADIDAAKAIVITIPDIVSQHETISRVQSASPDVKIIVRGDMDEDVQTLKTLKVEKIVQPEFEGSVAIVKDIFKTMGKSKEEIFVRLKNLRLSHAH
ncbi:MAG: cation:proton antiporter [Patescibacteria group bacterium]|mgnify:CR=1 FL=1